MKRWKERVKVVLLATFCAAMVVAYVHDLFYVRTARPHGIGWCLQ